MRNKYLFIQLIQEINNTFVKIIIMLNLKL